MVIWLIGLSASGKTTIGKKLHEQLESNSKEKWFFLDGDMFRNVMGEELGHTVEDRRKNAYRISNMCKLLNSQGINVVACVLSIFHDNQQFNRESIENYKEVFIDIEFEKLLERDNKNLYKKALNGEIKDVVGVDIEFKKPYAPDFVVDNNADDINFSEVVDNIIRAFDIDIDNSYKYTQNNLLDTPHKYQYSLYEGAQFLDKFHQDREDKISFLEKKIARFEETDISNKYGFILEECAVEEAYDIAVNIYASKKILNAEYIELSDYLIEVYEHMQKNRDISKIDKKIFFNLIKRFEVSKKLYLRYDNIEVRKVNNELNDMTSYALFSLVIQKYYALTQSPEEKLICMNVFLKLNDILSSIHTEFVSITEILMAVSALKGELNIIKTFSKDNL